MSDRDLARTARRVADKVVLRIAAVIIVIFFLGPFLLDLSTTGHGLGLLVVIAVLVGAVLIRRRSKRR
jgi:uncharacterized protein (TIGR03382 family)